MLFRKLASRPGRQENEVNRLETFGQPLEAVSTNSTCPIAQGTKSLPTTQENRPEPRGKTASSLGKSGTACLWSGVVTVNNFFTVEI